MTFTYNGIGTRYVGRKDLTSRPGQCEHCHRSTTFRSYDTRKFFVVIYIPLIPLARMHVLDQCSACTWHRAFKLEDWQRLKAEQVDGAMAKLREAPRDADAVREAMNRAAAFGDGAALDEVVQVVTKDHVRDADVQSELASALRHLGRENQAEAWLKSSLALKDDQGVREQLAYLAAVHGRPDEARQLVQFLIDDRRNDRVPLLFMVVDAYQAEGRHGEALDLLARIADIAPAVVSERRFRKRKDVSEKNLNTGKRVKTHLPVMRGAAGATSPRRIATILGAVAAVAVVGWLVAAFIIGKSRTVWVVNGLTEAYSVSVNGSAPRRLVPKAPDRVEVPEGDITVEVVDGAEGIAPVKTSLNTPFLLRPIQHPVLVINPDRAAVLHRTVITYASDTSGTPPEAPHDLFAGEPTYVWDEIDHPFEAPPDEIEVDSSSGTATRSTLEVLTDFAPMMLVGLVEGSLGQAKAITVAEAHLRQHPDDAAVLRALSFVMKPREFEASLRPQLDVRPIRINVHRAWQDATAKHGLEKLEADYRERLAASPGDVALTYLLARVTRDPRESQRLLDIAANATPPLPEALSREAWAARYRGEFPAALEWAKKLIAAQPTDVEAQSTLYASALAAGDMDEAFAVSAKLQAAMPVLDSLRSDQVRLLAASGNLDGAQRNIEEQIARARTTSPESVKDVKVLLEAARDYGLGKTDSICPASKKIPTDHDLAFQCAVIEGRFADAVKLIDDLGGVADAHAMHHLTVALAADIAGDAATANAEHDAAVAALREGDITDAAVADALELKRPPTHDELVELPMEPMEKRVVLAWLGRRYPSARSDAYALAKVMNYDPEWPRSVVAAGVQSVP